MVLLAQALAPAARLPTLAVLLPVQQAAARARHRLVEHLRLEVLQAQARGQREVVEAGAVEVAKVAETEPVMVLDATGMVQDPHAHRTRLIYR